MFLAEQFKMKETDEEDYVLVDRPYSLDKYMGYQVNVILFQWLKNNKKILLAPNTDFNKSDILFANEVINNQTLAIFKTVIFPLENVRLHQRYLTLEEAFKLFEKAKMPCQKIIIPMIVLKRAHFRLLVIDLNLNKAIFYDSKAKPVGVLCEAASSSSLKDYCYVQSMCSEYFKSIQYEEAQLGHQAVLNDRDCGPYTVEYAIHALSAVNIPLKMDIGLIRAKHEELFQLHAITAKNQNVQLSPYQYHFFYQPQEIEMGTKTFEKKSLSY